MVGILSGFSLRYDRPHEPDERLAGPVYFEHLQWCPILLPGIWYSSMWFLSLFFYMCTFDPDADNLLSSR